MIKIKRIYLPFSKEDGFRILVDRLWPRGISKSKAKLDLWLKEIAPSTELRKAFGHDPKKWNFFQKKYFQELKDKKNLIDEIAKVAKKEKGDITLLYGAKDEKLNNAVSLLKYLKRKLPKSFFK